VRVSSWLTAIGTCKGNKEFIIERSREGEKPPIRGDERKTGGKDNEINKKRK